MRTTVFLLVASLIATGCGRDAPGHNVQLTPDAAQDGQPGESSGVGVETPGDLPTDTPSEDAPESDVPVFSTDPEPGPEPELAPEPLTFQAPLAVGEARGVQIAGFTADGAWLAWLDSEEGIADATLFLTEVRTGETHHVADHVLIFSPRAVQFSPDGRLMIFRTVEEPTSASYLKGTLHVMDLEQGTAPTVVQDGVYRASVRFTPDGQRLVFNGVHGVEVWDAETRRVTYLADTARYNVYAPAESMLPASADGRYAAFEARHGLHLCDLDRGSCAQVEESVQTQSARFDADGERLVWIGRTGRSGFMRVRLLSSGVEMVSPEGAAHVLSEDGLHVAYLHDAEGDGDFHELRVADLATGEVRVVDAQVDSYLYGFSPDGARLVYLSGRETSHAYTAALHIWDYASGDTRLLEESIFTNWSDLGSVQFSPDSAWLVYQPAVSYGERSTALHHLPTGRTIDGGEGGCVSFYADSLVGLGAQPEVAHCSLFLGDGRALHGRTGADGVQLSRIDLVTGEHTLLTDVGLWGLRLSPSAELLATASGSNPREQDLVVFALEGDRSHTLAREVWVSGLAIADTAVAWATRDANVNTVWVSRVR